MKGRETRYIHAFYTEVICRLHADIFHQLFHRNDHIWNEGAEITKINKTSLLSKVGFVKQVANIPDKKHCFADMKEAMDAHNEVILMQLDAIALHC